MTENNVDLQFVWDPYLNSTRLYDELLSYHRAMNTSPGDERNRGASIVLVGGGLWHVRYIEVHLLEQYRKAVQHIASYMRLHSHQGASDFGLTRPVTMAADQDVLLLAPVQVPAYEDLSSERLATISAGQIDAMNGDLLEMSDNGTADVIWSYTAMTRTAHTHEADGLHVVHNVADMKADVLLNLRCNARAAFTGRYPFDRTCCSRYSPQNWAQRLMLFGGLLILPILAIVVGKGA